MLELLSRPRVFVLAFWVGSMLLSALLGGLMFDFDAGTLVIWLILAVTFPALVLVFPFVERRAVSAPVNSSPELARRPARSKSPL